ncbi:MAG: dTDP-4-dehydrorhamnose reductase [Candidatus Nealsonbacteria bacterium]|nr:dTDP-4-dehydrorhamnose reductase [Candidatus Nealsonbacteria bacterium]
MKIVVTGARGQLGKELCYQLAEKAVATDVDTLDLTERGAVRRAILDMNPDAIINCAAYTAVDQAESEPGVCRAVNAMAPEYLAAVAMELDCPLVQISTDHVFNGPPDRTEPYREDEPPTAESVYARTKLEGEQAAAKHEKHLIVRTCGLYARPSDEQAGNFVKTMLRLGRTVKELSVVADQHCTPSYVPDVARAVAFLVGATAAEPAPWGIYHVTNRGRTTWHEFATEIFRLADVDVPVRAITTAEYGPAAPRPAYSVLDTTKYESLGGPAMPTWQEALAEYFS